MANRTDPSAKTIHGTNPQFLIQKIVRQKIYSCNYWKQQCFGLTAQSIIDKAVELKYIGGTFGGTRRPTPFICLVLKLLQISPEKQIIFEFLNQKEHKYLRALAGFYVRITYQPKVVYTKLESIYSDYRKVRMRNMQGYKLLRQENICDIMLPRLPKRQVLEENQELKPRVSLMDKYLNDQTDGDEVDKVHSGMTNDIGDEVHVVQQDKEQDSFSRKAIREKQKSQRHRSLSTQTRQMHHQHNNFRPQEKQNQSRYKDKKSYKQSKRDPDAPPPYNNGSQQYWMYMRSKLGMKPLN